MSRFFALLAVVLAASSSAAQTTYTRIANGAWTDAAGWSPVGVPGSRDTVDLGTRTVTLDTDTTVAVLRLRSASAVLRGTSDLLVTDTLRWEAGRSEATGTLTVGPDATLRLLGDFRMGTGGVLRNQGRAVWEADVEWGGTGQFVNEGALDLAYDAASPARLCFSSTADAVVNAATGVIRRTGTGEVVIYCPFANHGRVEILAGAFRLRDFNGAGGTDSGDYDVAAGAVLLFDGRRTLTETASVTGEGTVRTGGNSASTATIDGTLNVPVVEVTGGVGLVLNTDASVDTLRMGGPLSSSRRLGGSGTLTVTRELAWTQGYFEGSGATIVAAGATLTLDVQTNYSGLRGSRRLINEGAATWTSDGSHHLSNHTEAVFENRGTLVVTAANGGAFSDFFGGTFVNAEGGVVRRMGEGLTRFGAGFDNHGTVEVLEGGVELRGFNATGGTDSGRYVVAEGARLAFTGGQRTLTERAEVAGAGTVVIVDTGSWHTFTNAAAWKPGAPTGTLTVESDYPAEDAVLEVELGGYAPGAEHDQLVVAGEAALGGTLRVVLADGFAPQAGDRFTVLAADEVTGAFASLDLPEGLSATVEATDTTAVLVVSAVVAGEAAAGGGLPEAFALRAPYPNPATGLATVAFELPSPAHVRVAVFDALGREVTVLLDGERPPGTHTAVLDATKLPPGLYLVRMMAGEFAAVRPVTRLR